MVVVRSRGKILGLVPYDFRSLSLERAQRTFRNAEYSHFLVPTFYGVGWTANLRRAPRHPWQAFLLAAFVLWRLRVGRRRGR
jgi:hypothetical protein